MRKRLLTSFALSLLGSSILLAPAAAQSYTAIPLGTLPGYDGASAAGINALGEIVGTVGQQDTAKVQAFAWQNGVMQSLAGSQSEALAVNDAGAIVGEAQGSTYAEHAALWQNGALIDLGTLSGGLNGNGSSIATGINAAGQVVGYSTVGSSSGLHAFLWDSAHGMQDLGTLGGLNSSATGINAHGQIVGTADTSSGSDAFLWDASGGMQDLGLPSGTDSPSQATAINGLGVVAAYGDYVNQTTDTSGPLGFTWDASHGWRGIGTLSTNIGSAPLAINDVGQLVGNYVPAVGTPSSAFVAEGGVLTDLNSVTTLPAGITLNGATGINSAGQIIADTRYSSLGGPSPYSQAYLLTPAPEPSAPATLGLGILIMSGMMVQAHRRRAAVKGR